jgi:hypothetical protein
VHLSLSPFFKLILLKTAFFWVGFYISTAYPQLSTGSTVQNSPKWPPALVAKGFYVVEKLGKSHFGHKVGKSVTLCEKVEKLSHGRISW